MESDRFDALTARLAPLSRRRSLALVGVLGVAGMVSTAEDASGKKKRKKRNKRKKPTTTPAPTGPTCTDGFINGNETDVDCGGSCPRCGVGKVCQFRRDCTTAYCNEGICTQCTNHTQCGADCECIDGTCLALLSPAANCEQCPAGTVTCRLNGLGDYYVCLKYCGATLAG